MKNFTAVVERNLSPMEEAVRHIHADPSLSPDAASRITSVMKDLYAALARKMDPPDRLVACHLRAGPLAVPV